MVQEKKQRKICIIFFYTENSRIPIAGTGEKKLRR